MKTNDSTPGELLECNPILTKREYFAAMAFQGMIVKYGNDITLSDINNCSHFSDLLIESLNGGIKQ